MSNEDIVVQRPSTRFDLPQLIIEEPRSLPVTDPSVKTVTSTTAEVLKSIILNVYIKYTSYFVV